MFEAYKIATTLSVVDEVSPVIMRLTGDFTKLQKLSASVTRGFDAIGKSSSGIDRLARSVQNLNNQLSNTIKRAERAAGAMSGMGAQSFNNGSSFNGPIPNDFSRSAAASAFYPMAAASAYSMGRGGGGLPPIYNAPLGLGGSGNYPMPYSASGSGYIDSTATRLSNGGGGFYGPNKPEGWWSGKPGLPIGTIGGMGAAAGMGATFGGGILATSAIKHSTEYDQEATRLRLYGMDSVNNAEAMRFADSMSIPGVDKIHALKFLGEAQGIFRESGLEGESALEGAKLAAPFLAKIHAATAALGPEGQAMSTAKGLSMLRFIEMMGGLKNGERFNELANMGWKMTQTSGGAVDWEQLRQFEARAGVSGQNMSALGLVKMEPIIAELKGSTAGFAQRTAFNRLNGIIKLPNQAAHFLADNGIWDASKIEWNKMGGIKSFKGNPFTDNKSYSEDNVGWYEKKVMPLYAKKGITDMSEIGRMNAMMFGSTGGNMFTLIHKQIATINKSVEAQNKALSVNDSLNTTLISKQGQLNTITQKYSDLLTKLGDDIFPTVTVVMNAFIVPLKLIGKIFEGYNLIGKAIADTPVVGNLVGKTAASVASIFGSEEAKSALIANGDTPLTREAIIANAKLLGGKNEGAPVSLLFNKPVNRKENSESAKDPGRYIATKSAPMVQTTTQINLDGRKVAEAVTQHQAKAASRPQSGSSMFDYTMAPPPVGLNYAR